MALDLHDIFQPGECRGALAASPLCRIERLAREVALVSPTARGLTEEIRAAVDELRAGGPSREEILEAIEDACGDDLSGPCAARIADAVTRALRGR
jgi:hypothetical protein